MYLGFLPSFRRGICIMYFTIWDNGTIYSASPKLIAFLYWCDMIMKS